MATKFQQIRTLLNSQTTLTLATTDDHSNPHSTPLFYLSTESLQLYWYSSHRSLHSIHCARNPRVSVTIYRAVQSWREIQGLQMYGTVVEIRERQLRETITVAYAEHFELNKALRFAMRRSGLYCFTPSWTRYLDNSRRLGYKFEIATSA